MSSQTRAAQIISELTTERDIARDKLCAAVSKIAELEQKIANLAERPKPKFEIGARVQSTIQFTTYETGAPHARPPGWRGTVKEHWPDGRIMVEMDTLDGSEVHTFSNETDELEVASDD